MKIGPKLEREGYMDDFRIKTRVRRWLKAGW